MKTQNQTNVPINCVGSMTFHRTFECSFEACNCICWLPNERAKKQTGILFSFCCRNYNGWQSACSASHLSRLSRLSAPSCMLVSLSMECDVFNSFGWWWVGWWLLCMVELSELFGSRRRSDGWRTTDACDGRSAMIKIKGKKKGTHFRKWRLILVIW